jgi:hypothetical protein
MFQTLITWYLAIALIVFSIWFVLFWLDTTTPKTHLLSWLVLLIAPLFWPIVIPPSCVELIGKLWRYQQLSIDKKREPSTAEYRLQTSKTR